ncbi:MAG: hypothetical protein LBF92_06730 [Synergistaceae bacterium]|jgi:hypothetical protein|nr:hypothetical protein [Synergistaceae bacterium]
MTETITTAGAENRLCLEEFELSENAINTIATIMGFTLTDLNEEKRKENKDEKKIQELEEKFFEMGRERLEIYSGNTEMKQSVIERYSDYIRERVVRAGQ